MPRRRDARTILEALVGKTIQTLAGRPNVVVGIEGDEARVERSSAPRPPRAYPMGQDALDQLEAEGAGLVMFGHTGHPCPV